MGAVWGGGGGRAVAVGKEREEYGSRYTVKSISLLQSVLVHLFLSVSAVRDILSAPPFPIFSRTSSQLPLSFIPLSFPRRRAKVSAAYFNFSVFAPILHLSPRHHDLICPPSVFFLFPVLRPVSFFSFLLRPQ